MSWRRCALTWIGRWLWLVCAAVALFLVHMPSASAQQSIVVSGRVVDDDTGAPLRGARIGRGPLEIARTDANGRFEISVIESRLQIIVSKAGFVRQDVVQPTSVPRQIEVRMIRGAAVTVHVINMAGDPVAGANVNVRCARSGRGGPSDDLGQLRVGGLTPGRCEVNVAGTGGPLMLSKGDPTIDQLRAMFEALRTRALKSMAERKDSTIALDLRPGEEAALVVLDTREAPPVPPVTVAGPSPGAVPGTGIIRGRIIGSDGRPIPGAQVIISVPPGGMKIADEKGTYEFTGLPAGRFRVRASLPPMFAMREFGQDGTAAGRDIVLEPGQQLARIDITLVRGGVITGTVLDEYGEPTEGAQVRLLRTDPVGGSSSVTAGLGVQTDDRGRYRLAGVTPGTYYVGATLNATGQSGQMVFFPGVATVVDALPIPLRENQEVGSVDMFMNPALGVALRGHVVNSAGASASGGMALLTRSPGQPASGPSRMASVDATGAFEFANVTPGEYEVSVTASPPPFAILTHHRSQPVPAPPIPQTEYGRAVVSVQAAGAASVMVSTRPGSSIRGRVTIEGSREGVLPSMFRLTAVAGSVPPALVADNWTFEMRGLSAPTRFLVTSSQPGWWLKAFDVAGVNGADEPVFTVGGVRDATVVLARTSRISGQVVDNGGAVSRCPIIAFPADRARWYDRSQYVKTGISGSDGRFQFEVPPGEYLIVAVDRLQAPGASADFLNVLEPLATRVTIVEVQAVQQDLRLVRVP